MILKEYIRQVINSVNREDLKIGITFELEVDSALNVISGGGQKIKFSCKKK